MKAGNININWNQNGGQEQGKSHIDAASTTVQREENAKRDEDDKRRRCGETKDEEQSWDGNGYRNRNETRSLDFLCLRIHGDARVNFYSTTAGSFIQTSLSTESESPDLFMINQTCLQYTTAGSSIQSSLQARSMRAMKFFVREI